MPCLAVAGIIQKASVPTRLSVGHAFTPNPAATTAADVVSSRRGISFRILNLVFLWFALRFVRLLARGGNFQFAEPAKGGNLLGQDSEIPLSEIPQTRATPAP